MSVDWLALHRELADVLVLRVPSARLDDLVTGDHALSQTIVAANAVAGPGAFRRLIALYRRGLTDFELRVRDQFTDGAAVVSLFDASATHSGVMGLLKPTGKRLSMTALLASRGVEATGEHEERGARFAETRLEIDALGFMGQMGTMVLRDDADHVQR